MQDPSIHLDQRVAVLCTAVSGRPLASCFRFKRHALYLTAKHALPSSYRPQDLCVEYPGRRYPAAWVKPHPTVDIAAVGVFDNGRWPSAETPCFQPGLLPPGEDYDQGELVYSYGYAIGADGRLNPRLIIGTIDSRYTRDGSGGFHVDYELSFASSGGHSGSPIIRAANTNEVIGVITDYLEYDFPREDGAKRTVVRRTTAAAPLLSIRDWLAQL